MFYGHQSRPRSVVFWFVGLLALLAAGIFAEGSSTGTAVPAHASPANAPVSPLLTPTATCLPLWSTVSNPPENSQVFTLESIATLSANHVWAVGFQLRN